MCELWQLLIVFEPIGSEYDARKEFYIIQDSLFAKRESFLFDFIYPHKLNSYLFSGIPQVYVAAHKNRINNAVLLWNKTFTYAYIHLPMLANQSPIRNQK